MESKFKITGVKNVLNVFDDRLEITPKGLLGFVEGNGNETILIKDVKTIGIRECSFFNGGHVEIITNAITRKIDFGGWSGRAEMNKTAKEIKTFLLSKIV
jgi:hypothetical protein